MYKSLSKTGNPYLKNTSNLLIALNMQFALCPAKQNIMLLRHILGRIFGKLTQTAEINFAFLNHDKNFHEHQALTITFHANAIHRLKAFLDDVS